MKYLILLLCFSCAAWGQKEFEISDKIDRHDSTHFKIMRAYYVSGQICYESLTDTIKKLRHEKNYYHGRLIEEGNMDAKKNFHVGVWKYYSPNGKFKKVNFDSTSLTSYYQAIQIAKSYGYNESGIEINEKLIKRKYYWEVEYWSHGDCDPCHGEYILIRRSNGKVTKPKNNKITIFN